LAQKRNVAVLPSLCAVLLLSSGCYTDKAIFDPWSYAPACPDRVWQPCTTPCLDPLPCIVNELSEQEEPYTLAEVIDLALKNNTQTQVTWARARAAAAKYGQSESSDWPVIAANYTADRNRTPNIVAGLPGGPPSAVIDEYLTQWGPQLTLSYTLWDFGQLKYTSRALRYALYYADWTHNRAIESLIKNVTTDYYNYLYQKQLMISNQADVDTAQQTFDAANLQLEMGVKSASDMLQAQTQLLQKQLNWVSQKKSVQNSLAQLLNDMGISSAITLNLQDLPQTLPREIVLQGVEELLTVAMQKRSDLLAAEADLASKKDSVKAAQRQFLPNITYSFDIGKTYFGLFDVTVHDKYNFNSLFTLNIPLFAAFHEVNGLKIAKADQEESEAQLKQLELAVTQDVTTSHYNVKNAYESFIYAEKFLEAAEKEYQVLLAKYKMGTTTILDVLTAQSALADARSGKANAIQNWYTAFVALNYATGILAPSTAQPKGAP